MFQSSVSVVPGGSLPRPVSLIVIFPWYPGTQAPLATRARQLRIIPWTVATNPGHQTHVRTYPPRDAGALECGRGSVKVIPGL